MDVSDAQILQEFGTLFDDPAAVWDTLPVCTLPECTRNTLSDVADINSLMVGRYKPGETLISRGMCPFGASDRLPSLLP
jgi:hypothetical protein